MGSFSLVDVLSNLLLLLILVLTKMLMLIKMLIEMLIREGDCDGFFLVGKEEVGGKQRLIRQTRGVVGWAESKR